MTAMWRSWSGNVRGVILLALGALIVTIEQVILRYASQETTTAAITAGRSLAQLMLGIVLVTSLGEGWRGTVPRKMTLQLFRGASSLMSWWLYYYSFRVLDFTVATTLNFTTSLYVAILAGPIMGERVTGARWAATILGFLGVLLVVRPGATGHTFGILAGLGSAICGVAIVFSNRALGLSDRTETTMLWVGVVTTLGSLPFAIAGAEPMAWRDLAIVALASIVGASALWVMLEAFRVGEASALGPVPYLRLVYAALAGWLLFDERPDLWTLAGCVVIAASGVALARAEARGR
jgi:drug/metabolite transporter (DMT)-like permease